MDCWVYVIDDEFEVEGGSGRVGSEGDAVVGVRWSRIEVDVDVAWSLFLVVEDPRNWLERQCMCERARHPSCVHNVVFNAS